MDNNIILGIVKKISNLAKTCQFKVCEISKRQYDEYKIIEAMDEPQKSRIMKKYHKSINKRLTKNIKKLPKTL